jgi:phosphoribosylformylglycinamidine (FGAM) synthase-like enzyme/phosphoribosylformylglycinamidine (FGAM) synthase PurS component
MITTIYKKRIHEDPPADKICAQLQRAGYRVTGINLENVIRVETDRPMRLDRLHPLLCNPVVETLTSSSQLDGSRGPIREVCYQRAMTDPEMESFISAAKSVKLNDVRWVRLATRYQFCGLAEDEAEEVTERLLCNAQTQTVIRPNENWLTLVPQGEPWPIVFASLDMLDDDDLRALSAWRRLNMPLEQLRAMQSFFVSVEPRLARDAEIEMFAGRWSNHCSHTHWRALHLFDDLKDALRVINHPLVKSALVDNSGVMLFYGGYCICLKVESHIYPTFAGDPFGGIMTLHGGILRDIIWTAQGAWPFASTIIMGTVDPKIAWSEVPQGAFHPQVVLQESIRGTHDYTNPMGVPMAWSEYLIHPRNWKGLAIGQCFGVLPESRATKGQPQPGDYVLLIGEPTGNDGIHGATVSSGDMTAETCTIDASSVQIGMPIGERGFMEVVPILRDADCTRAGTDCGAVGLSSAVGELGEETGVWVNTACVPLKCASLSPWQIWISESQERGVTAVPPDKLRLALSILADYEVRAAVIGVFTDTGRCQVVHSTDHQDHQSWPVEVAPNEVVIDLPYSVLKDGCPLPEIEVAPPLLILPGRDADKRWQPRRNMDWIRLIRQHLGTYELSDQSVAAHKYDQTVQGNTAVPYIGGRDQNMPDDISVFTPVRGQPWGAGIGTTVSQRWPSVNPTRAGELLMAGAMAKLVAAGFSPSDITCCVHVYTPPVTDSPKNARYLVDLVKTGYLEASQVLGMPVISGKESGSGRFVTAEGEIIDAPLTCAVAALGRIPDVNSVIPKSFANAHDVIMLFSPGATSWSLGGSVFGESEGLEADLPGIDLNAFRQGILTYHGLVHDLGSTGAIHSRSTVVNGGLIRRLFEMSLGRHAGCAIELPGSRSPEQWLFGEFPSVVFTVRSKFAKSVLQVLGEDCVRIGSVTKRSKIEVWQNGAQLFSAPMGDLSADWSRRFKEVAQ